MNNYEYSKFDYETKLIDNRKNQITDVYENELEKEKDKEIKRLNNIINELEKWLEEVWEENLKGCSYESVYISGKCFSYKNVLNKLKELKENKDE